MCFDGFAVDYFRCLGVLRGSLDYVHDNGYYDYDESVPRVFVEAYKAAYRRGFDDERMVAQF